MPHLEFDIAYSYPDDVTGIPVPVIVTYDGNSEKALAKLDSGSEFCVFTNNIGRLLGIPIETGLKKTFDTPGGLVDAYGHEVTLQSFGYTIASVVYFAASPALRRNLLGRQGWIRNFHIGLIDYDNLLYLSPYR
ncbi:MAG: hypothetical protein MOB07_16450 [Acidobacteria bacterium]|nr:hypothetical protein [Acidobacteriota bacterium]